MKWLPEHEDFYFVPRKNNNRGRRDKRMLFCGSEKYIVITFWNKSYTKDKIYLINWDCNTSGKVSIVLCCRGVPEKQRRYIVEIKNMIEATGKKFEKIMENNWKWYYCSNMNYIETLEDFVKHEFSNYPCRLRSYRMNI